MRRPCITYNLTKSAKARTRLTSVLYSSGANVFLAQEPGSVFIAQKPRLYYSAQKPILFALDTSVFSVSPVPYHSIMPYLIRKQTRMPHSIEGMAVAQQYTFQQYPLDVEPVVVPYGWTWSTHQELDSYCIRRGE